MATISIVDFKKGLKENLPLLRQPDTIYITTDSGEGYLGNLKLWATENQLPILISQTDYDNLTDDEKLNNNYDVYIP